MRETPEPKMLRPAPTRLPIKEADLAELEEARKRREAAAIAAAGKLPAPSSVTPPVARSAADRIGLGRPPGY